MRNDRAFLPLLITYKLKYCLVAFSGNIIDWVPSKRCPVSFLFTLERGFYDEKVVNLLKSACPVSYVGGGQVVYATDFYIESSLGRANYDGIDSSTENVTIIPPNTNLSWNGNLKASSDYKSGHTYGIEIGVRDFSRYPLRLGLAWQNMEAKNDRTSITHPQTGIKVRLRGEATNLFTYAENEALLSDNDMQVWSVNLYYDLPLKIAFKPYVGVGIGWADMDLAKSKERAYLFHLGGRYEIAPGVNVGIKYQYIDVDDFTHKKLEKFSINAKYDGMDAQVISATISYDF